MEVSVVTCSFRRKPFDRLFKAAYNSRKKQAEHAELKAKIEEAKKELGKMPSLKEIQKLFGQLVYTFFP